MTSTENQVQVLQVTDQTGQRDPPAYGLSSDVSIFENLFDKDEENGFHRQQSEKVNQS